jgi:hypothetical protein
VDDAVAALDVGLLNLAAAHLVRHQALHGLAHFWPSTSGWPFLPFIFSSTLSTTFHEPILGSGSSHSVGI